MALKTDFNRLH